MFNRSLCVLSTLAASSAYATAESPQGQTSKKHLVSIWRNWQMWNQDIQTDGTWEYISEVFGKTHNLNQDSTRLKSNLLLSLKCDPSLLTCLAHSKLKAPDVPSLAILLILYLFHWGLSSILSVAKRTKNSSLGTPKCRSQGGTHSAFPSLSSSIFSVGQTKINVIDA